MGRSMRRPSSPQAWATWDKASNRGLLLTSPNFRPFRTQNNDNTLPGKKKIPLGLCKISSVLPVPLSPAMWGSLALLIPCTHFHILCFPPRKGSLGAARSLCCSSQQGQRCPSHPHRPNLLHSTWEGSTMHWARWRSCRGGRGGNPTQGNPSNEGEAQIGLHEPRMYQNCKTFRLI